jgi:hypothetical protein
VDGYVLSAVFMNLPTWYLWEAPMMKYTAATDAWSLGTRPSPLHARSRAPPPPPEVVLRDARSRFLLGKGE